MLEEQPLEFTSVWRRLHTAESDATGLISPHSILTWGRHRLSTVTPPRAEARGWCPRWLDVTLDLMAMVSQGISTESGELLSIDGGMQGRPPKLEWGPLLVPRPFLGGGGLLALPVCAHAHRHLRGGTHALLGGQIQPCGGHLLEHPVHTVAHGPGELLLQGFLQVLPFSLVRQITDYFHPVLALCGHSAVLPFEVVFGARVARLRGDSRLVSVVAFGVLSVVNVEELLLELTQEPLHAVELLLQLETLLIFGVAVVTAAASRSSVGRRSHAVLLMLRQPLLTFVLPVRLSGLSGVSGIRVRPLAVSVLPAVGRARHDPDNVLHSGPLGLQVVRHGVLPLRIGSGGNVSAGRGRFHRAVL
ncbi:hypothetical protein EYF80_013387 [Liparis tanakae]|uniref:Uncharacterized protein n=1 Tax=Liparis tanakae TaxID=230148 RepID=A0A4Z2IE67_9TELE|nr:hypothetical protein EYF80_013387 [Liparis tanakae]